MNSRENVVTPFKPLTEDLALDEELRRPFEGAFDIDDSQPDDSEITPEQAQRIQEENEHISSNEDK